MKWDKYRDEQGYIDLILVFDDLPEREWMELVEINRAIDFLGNVMEMQPIVSRQGAAVALSSALRFAYLPLSGE